ncbi:hypothetical protein M378DRAFT_171257 [Amanita muscaria Koide BX008]|uniref:Uncharacterized protein n=1 Tax=Amanita muscaria (strain Koide BX008) TaxID=946122 RepID=A0A0C2S580_AMAMK|nr:hypothetical protein M378DRAFT_171257 [Amanita muscaria Koide BX008]
MHRRALLDTIQTWTSPSLLEQQEYLWLTNEVTAHQIADPEDGSVQTHSQNWSSARTGDSPTFSTQTSRTFPTSHISADSVDSGSLSISSGISTFLQVPWAKRNAEMMARLGSGEGENNGNNEQGQEEKEEGFEILDHKGVLSEDVYMGLKCLVYCAPDEYDFDLVLMEEKGLFGVKLDRHGWEEGIKSFLYC